MSALMAEATLRLVPKPPAGDVAFTPAGEFRATSPRIALLGLGSDGRVEVT